MQKKQLLYCIILYRKYFNKGYGIILKIKKHKRRYPAFSFTTSPGTTPVKGELPFIISSSLHFRCIFDVYPIT